MIFGNTMIPQVGGLKNWSTPLKSDVIYACSKIILFEIVCCLFSCFQQSAFSQTQRSIDYSAQDLLFRSCKYTTSYYLPTLCTTTQDCIHTKKHWQKSRRAKVVVSRKTITYKSLGELSLSVHPKLGYKWATTSLRVCHLWPFVLILAQPLQCSSCTSTGFNVINH